MLKIILFVIFALFSSNTFAVSYQDAKVTEIHAGYEDGTVYIKVDETLINPAGCSNTSSYSINASRDVRSMFAMLLVARTTGETISIGVEDGECFKDRPTVHKLGLK